MSFRFLDQVPQFLTTTGEVLASGTLTFSASGTSTPLATYSDMSLTAPNTNPVILDASGKPTTDIWMNGNYRVVCADFLGAVQWTRDNVQVPGGSGLVIPSLVNGDFLTNNGSVMQWLAIRQGPDPTGQVNKVLSTDGTNYLWIPKPTNGTNGAPGAPAAITVSASSFTAGDGVAGHDIFWMQHGSATAPASGGHGTNTTVTFPSSFKAVSAVVVTPTSASVATAGYLVIPAITSKSVTGFAVSFDTNSSDGGNGNIINTVPFDWIAVGTKAG